MAIPKFLEDLLIISKLGDNPGADNGLSSSGLRGKFDEAGVKIQKYINDTLIPSLSDQFAPAGYGLGDAVKKDWSEVDNLTDPGWYYFSDPNGIQIGVDTFNYIYMRVDSYGSTAAAQTLYPVAVANPELVRIKRAGEWNEWEWKNPRMFPGVEYRTTKRWNGKVVYTKAVDYGALPNGAVKNVLYCAAGATACLGVRLLLSDGCTFTSGYNRDLGFSTSLGAYVDNTLYNVRVYTDGDFSSLTAIAAVEYTKD